MPAVPPFPGRAGNGTTLLDERAVTQTRTTNPAMSWITTYRTDWVYRIDRTDWIDRTDSTYWQVSPFWGTLPLTR